MSGLMDKVKDKATAAVGKKEDNFGQPGNNVERRADDSVNTQVDNFAGQGGVPQQDDNMLNKFVDNKVNKDIPGGN